MANKIYQVIFKEFDMGSQFVIAESAQIHGEHLVFLDADDKLAALFLLDIIESWSLVDAASA